MTCVSSRAPLLAFKLKEVGDSVVLAPLRGSVGGSRRGSQPSSHPKAVQDHPSDSGPVQRLFEAHLAAPERHVADSWSPLVSECSKHGSRRGGDVRIRCPGPPHEECGGFLGCHNEEDQAFVFDRSQRRGFRSEWIQQNWQVFHDDHRSSDPKHHRDLALHRAIARCRFRFVGACFPGHWACERWVGHA